MKKLLFVAAVAVFALFSCKKDYTCTYDFGGEETVVDYEGLDKDEADAAETACDAFNGTWE